MPYERRTYRERTSAAGLVAFRVKLEQTDLEVCAERDLSEPARLAAGEARAEIERWARRDPGFLEALEPRDVPADAPEIVQEMARAGTAAGVGPMAAVAGAIAERVGMSLLDESREVIVENGGDIFMKTSRPRRVGIFAGESPLSMKLAVEIAPETTPLGVATSSATVGPSLSFGRADAAVVLARPSALADAVATALGNRALSRRDIDDALSWALSIGGVRGALLIVDEKLAVRGDIRLVSAADG